MSKTPLVGPPPSVQIRSPHDGDLIRNDAVKLQLVVNNWVLQPAPGNHVHVKVDDHEEIAVRDVSGPIALDELFAERAGTKLPEGTHVLRVFLSRPNHESVKLPSAFAMIVFHYKSKTAGFELDRQAPMLTSSRPQGCAADPSRLLDFFLTNLNDLSRDGYRVTYNVDGVHKGILSGWAPYRIDGLSAGKHTLRLTLIGPNGEVVPGPFNDTTRTLVSDASCPTLGLITAAAHEDEEADDEADTTPMRGPER